MIVQKIEPVLPRGFGEVVTQLLVFFQEVEVPIPKASRLGLDMPDDFLSKKMQQLMLESQTIVAASRFTSALASDAFSLFHQDLSEETGVYVSQTNLSVRLRFFFKCSTSLRYLS